MPGPNATVERTRNPQAHNRGVRFFRLADAETFRDPLLALFQLKGSSPGPSTKTQTSDASENPDPEIVDP